MGPRSLIWACLLVVSSFSKVIANLDQNDGASIGPPQIAGNDLFPGSQPQVVEPSQFPGSQQLFSGGFGESQLYPGGSVPYPGFSQQFPGGPPQNQELSQLFSGGPGPYPSGLSQYTPSSLYSRGLPVTPLSLGQYGAQQALIAAIMICPLDALYPAASAHPICQNQNQFYNGPLRNFPPPLTQYGAALNNQSPFGPPSSNHFPSGNMLPFDQNHFSQLQMLSSNQLAGSPAPAYLPTTDAITEPQLFPACSPEALKLLGIRPPNNGFDQPPRPRPSSLMPPVGFPLPQYNFPRRAPILLQDPIPLPPNRILYTNPNFAISILPPYLRQILTENNSPFQKMNQFTENMLLSQQMNQFAPNGLPFQHMNPYYTANAFHYYPRNALQYNTIPTSSLTRLPYNPSNNVINFLSNAFPFINEQRYTFATNRLAYPQYPYTGQLYFSNPVPIVPVMNGTKSLL